MSQETDPFKNKQTSLEQDNGVNNASDESHGDTTVDGSFSGPGKRLRKFWQRSSIFEYCLFVSIAILILIVVVLLILYTSSRKDSGDGGICLTPTCVTAASTILSSLDLEADPCVDFYQYACGNWIKDNPLPEGHPMWSNFNVLDTKNKAIMKEALEENNNELESQAEKKARAYYMSCMDKDGAIEKTGAKPLLELIKRAGGWGISGDFDASTWDLQTSIERLNDEIRSQEFFTWDVTTDEKDSSNHILAIDQRNLILKRPEFYANQSVMNAYLEYMTQVGVLLGGKEKETRKQMREIQELERKLFQIIDSKPGFGNVDTLYNKMTLDELQQIAPVLDWQRMFAAAFRHVQRDISGSEKIVVTYPEYFRKLSIIWREYLSTNSGKRVLSNYIGWRVTHSLVSYLPKAFREARDTFLKALLDVGQREVRWKQCVSDISSEMDLAVGTMFVKKAFRKENKILAKQVLDEVREAFKANLEHLAWMDEETRQLARDKADAMTELIGFPDYILDPEKLDKEYDGLVINEDEYLENKLRLKNFFHMRNLKEIDQPVDDSRWEVSPGEANAFYLPTRNQIIFPAASLQPPFFHDGYPMSYNFGSLGVVMGHELTHGFDDQGRKFDKYGNLNQWWKNSTIENFENQTKCYVDQYSSFIPVNGHKINGEQTLSDNIADNGGVKAAYHAYKNWMKRHPEDPVLPGLNMTSNQLFFVGFAQAWCSRFSSEFLAILLMVDTHSPPKYRVLGSLANSPHFSREFNCPEGSPMNPRKKCEIW